VHCNASTAGIDEACKMAYYSRLRVIVEQWFGRMKRLMAMSRNVYILSREHRQTDTDNIIMLVNHHIRQFDLCSDDG
jgi:hypothetical protein